jgi:hypothetical protein
MLIEKMNDGRRNISIYDQELQKGNERGSRGPRLNLQDLQNQVRNQIVQRN